jgi:hypothetical protein
MREAGTPRPRITLILQGKQSGEYNKRNRKISETVSGTTFRKRSVSGNAHQETYNNSLEALSKLNIFLETPFLKRPSPKTLYLKRLFSFLLFWLVCKHLSEGATSCSELPARSGRAD